MHVLVVGATAMAAGYPNTRPVVDENYTDLNRTCNRKFKSLERLSIT